MTPETQQILILLGGCLLAFLAGFGLAAYGSRQNATRLRQAERDLEATREELEQYRQQVAEHFDGTSRLLRDLTLQYRAVYEHLAQGAQSLCPDGSNLLAPSLAQAALPDAARESEAAQESDVSRESEAEAPRAESAGEGADDLEPLLDPEPTGEAPEADREARP